MKVILSTESFSPNISGVAVATEILAKNLTEAGHEVFVFCPGDKNETFRDKNFPNFDVLRVKSMKNPFRKGFRITSASRKEIREQVERIKPDLIHLQDVATIGIMLRDTGEALNIPVIITNHFSLEFALAYVKSKFLLPIARAALIKYLVNFHDKCDAVFTPTETIAKQIRSWGVKTPVIAVSNGIYYDRFCHHMNEDKIAAFKEAYHLPDNDIVLYTGRIDKDKSVDVIISAIPKVVKATNAHFVFAGSGDKINLMEDLADSLGIRKDVTFLGRLDHDSEEFVALYKSASVFAIASTVETQSLVTLEAMSAGVPIVAAKANALPEIVREDVNGYLFTPGDVDTLADSIIKILKNQRLAKRLGQNSMHIAAQHEMSKAFARTMELYSLIIEQKKASQKIVIPQALLHPENK
jgi:glycosyltransferase involved in cell wall biosynthesis